MKKILIKIIGALISIACSVIFLSYLSEFLYFENGIIPKKTLLIPYNISREPTLIWLTILLVASVFVYLKLSKILSPKNPNKSKKLFEDHDFKWLLTVLHDKKYTVAGLPFCKHHNSRYIKMPSGQCACRELVGNKCNSKIIDDYEQLEFYKFSRHKG